MIIALFHPLPVHVPKCGVILCNCMVHTPFLCIYSCFFSKLLCFTDEGCCIVADTSVLLWRDLRIKWSIQYYCL